MKNFFREMCFLKLSFNQSPVLVFFDQKIESGK